MFNFLWIFIAAVIIVAIYIYRYIRWENNYFKSRGVKNLPFDAPFIGYGSVLFQKEHITDLINRIYSSFPDQKYVGYKQLNKYLFLVRDIETIKQTTIKDFDHFSNHLIVFDQDMDSIFGNILFALKDEKWHDMRATLSPAFTSSKMRNMFQFVVEIGQQMVDFYIDKLNHDEVKERGLIEIEVKDAFARYTNDVIATTAFGLKVNSLTKRENEFYEKGSDLTQFSGMRLFKIFMITTFPFVKGVVKAFPENLKQFFRDIILDTMKERKVRGIIRNDMIQLLMQAREGSLKYEVGAGEKKDAGFATVEESHVGQKSIRRQWNDDDIVAQAVLFFIAGFDTSSTALSFITYELAMNPDIQKRLHAEIDDFAATHDGGNLAYEDLAKMTYMDMVVSESLRKWPPVAAVDRECVKDYQLPPVSDNAERPCLIRKGEGLWIPISAIHHDPQYYPDPEKFDPMRFSEENKHNIRPFSYLPFGIGPRNCIGSRFALMQVKAILYQMLRKFELVPTAKTPIPIKFSPKSFTLVVENGIWLGLKPRNL